jgi:Rrf2 family protein
MLRISKKADYAVFLLGSIARQGAFPGGTAPESVVSAHEIARRAGLNKSVVANLLKEYAKHGILESVRGLKGGYRLVRAPHEVSLGEILEVVEGKFTLVECVSPHAGHGGGHPAGRSGATALLALAPSQAATTTSLAGDGESHHDCALIGFCPSRHPMRLVHERISKLFREIRLDELCSLPVGTAPNPRSPRPTAHRP